MRQFLTISCVLFLLSNCSQGSKKKETLSDFIPSNSAIIFKTSSLETLESDVKNNDFLNILSSKTLFDGFENELKKFDSLNIKNEAIICISSDHDISIISSFPNYQKEKDSLKLQAENFFKTTVDSFFVASTSKSIIDEISSQKNESNTYLNKLIQSSNLDSSVSVFINTEKATTILDSIYDSGSIKVHDIANWISLDAYLEQDKIMVNGVALVTDTIPKLINIFKNTVPQKNRTAKITPNDSDGFLSLTFHDFNVFNKNLIEYRSDELLDSLQLTLFKNVTEIGIIYKNKNSAIALYSNDIIETKDALLSEQNVKNTFREINIYNYGDKSLFKTVLNPFVNFEVNNYLILNEIVIFSNSEDLLKSIISHYQGKTAISDSQNYKDNMSYLSDESSMLFVGSNQNLRSKLVEKLSEKYKNNIKNLNLKHYKISYIQFVNDNSFAHINGIIQKNQSKAKKGSITQQFNIVLDNEILNSPQIIKNHRNHQKEIIVQDVKNNLYLISNRGKVLWKKQLRGPILGNVEQIDIYKNGRLQMAFATPNRVYILDRNGNNVGPFPIKFNDDITQPLSVFDYDNRKKYRFFVVQGKETLMMDTKGKTVRGFNFKKANSNIVTQPKHFRIGTKDYIVFASGKKLNILDRTGKTRIKVDKDFNFSQNEIYLYKGYFSFTNTKGQLVQVDQKGRVNFQNLVLPSDHSFTTTSKTLVTLADNKLTIKGKSIELDFGKYSIPKIFYLNDKIYVGISDLQSHKIFLFDSQTKIIPGFPVYGNSTPALDNLDNDRELEFVAKGESNSLIFYQIN